MQLNTLNSAADAQDQLCPVCRTQIDVKKLQAFMPPPPSSSSSSSLSLQRNGYASSDMGVSDDTRRRWGGTVLESKFQVLLRELARVRSKDATSKSLVFSQFNTTIEALKPRLLAAGFQWRSLAGNMTLAARAKALEEFQADPPTTVFLLSIRAGACGINLTQANEVFLLDPCLNPALEAQAIGRVHRLGQTRDVRVTRLVMAKSVEERILENQKAVLKPDSAEDAQFALTTASASAAAAGGGGGAETGDVFTKALSAANGVSASTFSLTVPSTSSPSTSSSSAHTSSSSSSSFSSSSSSSSSFGARMGFGSDDDNDDDEEEKVLSHGKSRQPVTQAGAVTRDKVNFKQTELSLLFS